MRWPWWTLFRGRLKGIGRIWWRSMGTQNNNKSPEFVIINEKWLFLSSAVLMIISYHRTNLSSDSTFQWYECKPEFWPEPELVCVRLNRREEKKKQTGQRQPRNRDSVGSSIVGNKLIPTSREPMGVGETPGLFPGKQSSISSSTPQNLSLPLSLSLSMSLSLSLLHAPMFFLGGVEEEGDDEVTHCNIIAMAMKSEPRGEERKRMGISIGGGEMEMAVTISVLKLIMEISVWCYLYWNISLPKTHISTFPCLLLHLLLHSFFDSVFLLDSSPCVLLPLLLARCAPPPSPYAL